MAITQQLGVPVAAAGPAGGHPARQTRGPQLPLRPLIDWINAQIARETRRQGLSLDAPNSSSNGKEPGPHRLVADRLGLNDRALYRIKNSRYAGSRNGRKAEFPATTISRKYVEDMCTRAGLNFYDLYPELEWERDVELEADAYCARCGEDVTPIEGCCPWCDRVVRTDIVLAWVRTAA